MLRINLILEISLAAVWGALQQEKQFHPHTGSALSSLRNKGISSLYYESHTVKTKTEGKKPQNQTFLSRSWVPRMLLHSGFQFWNKSEDHRDSMSVWFTLRYVKICPSKCQTPSPCSFAIHAARRSHYALHFTEQWKPHTAETCSMHSSPTYTWPQNSQSTSGWCMTWIQMTFLSWTNVPTARV